MGARKGYISLGTLKSDAQHSSLIERFKADHSGLAQTLRSRDIRQRLESSQVAKELGIGSTLATLFTLHEDLIGRSEEQGLNEVRKGLIKVLMDQMGMQQSMPQEPVWPSSSAAVATPAAPPAEAPTSKPEPEPQAPVVKKPSIKSAATAVESEPSQPAPVEPPKPASPLGGLMRIHS